MKDYEAKVRTSTKELTAREKIALKDLGNAIQLDTATIEHGTITIPVDYYAIVDVHNEKSDNKDYSKCVIVDTSGTKYCTGSESFVRKLEDIYDELRDCDETEMTIEVYRQESKNYKGKQFICCSLV